MTDLPFTPSANPARLMPRRLNPYVGLYAASAVGAGTGVVVALSAGPAVPLEWQLALLLRFMAVVKAAMVLGALGLTHWRLRRPTAAGVAAGYAASIGVMLVAPGLIWSLAHVALGALLFHAGLVTFLLLAWHEDATGGWWPRRRAAVYGRT